MSAWERFWAEPHSTHCKLTHCKLTHGMACSPIPLPGTRFLLTGFPLCCQGRTTPVGTPTCTGICSHDSPGTSIFFAHTIFPARAFAHTISPLTGEDPRRDAQRDPPRSGCSQEEANRCRCQRQVPPPLHCRKNNLSLCCILGDIRLWAGDPSTSCLGYLP